MTETHTRRWHRSTSRAVLASVVMAACTYGWASPSGADEWVAFTDVTHVPTLMMQRADGTGRTSLAPLTTFDPSWAPGGGRLASAGSSGLSPIVLSPTSMDCVNEVVPGDSGNYGPSWSPDGFHLAYWNSGEVRVVDTVTRTAVSLGPGFSPAWSPDGTTIAFADANGLSSIWLMNSDGSNRRNTGIAALSPDGVAWSPDSKRLAFVANASGGKAVETARASDGGDVKSVAGDPAPQHPSFSSDGMRIYFSGAREGSSAIFVANADGSGSIQRVSPPSVIDERPSAGDRAGPLADGYWMVGAKQLRLFDFGNTCPWGPTNPNSSATAPIVGISGTPDGRGAWTVSADGGVVTFGDAQFAGSAAAIRLNQPMVGMAATHGGGGYWLAAADGGVFSFGDARFFGSMGSVHLNQPVVGIVGTPDDGGYWLAAADGRVFSFGDARFFGSMANNRLNRPVVGITSTPDGGGYWLVAADGGVFSFGNARFFGSMAGVHLNQPVVTVASTGSGGGYWLAASDGGVFSFGDARYMGALTNDAGEPVVAITRHL